MSKTITSKQGVTYYNYNDVEDVTDIVSGRKYYKQLVSNCQTYRTKNLFYVEHISYKILETSNTFPKVTIA